MPIGARLCNLNIQLNSVLLRLAVLDGSNFGVHHSSTENCIFLWECPSFLKWRETGVGCPSFRIDALCSYILFLSALHVSPTYCLWHLVQVIRYMTLLISHVVCFGKSCGLNDLRVKLQFTVANFFIIGQYVHLPNLVQMLGVGVRVVFGTGGYMSEALVSMSLRLGSLLNPTIGK